MTSTTADTNAMFSSNAAHCCFMMTLKRHLVRCILLVRMEGGIWMESIIVDCKVAAKDTLDTMSLIVGSYLVLVSLAAHAALL